MSTMDKQRAGPVLPPGRSRRSFTADAVSLVLDGDRLVASVARDLGIGEMKLGNWVRQARIDRDDQSGLTTAERAGLVRLRPENAQLRMERDLPKRATAFWVAESGPRPATGRSVPGGPRGSRPNRHVAPLG